MCEFGSDLDGFGVVTSFKILIEVELWACLGFGCLKPLCIFYGFFLRFMSEILCLNENFFICLIFLLNQKKYPIINRGKPAN